MKVYLKTISVILVIFWVAILCVNVRGEKEKIDIEDLAATLKKVIEKNCEGMNKEDVDMAMSAIHTKASIYEPTKTLTVRVNTRYDLKYTILSFKFVTLDEDYAIARVKQRTTKIKGPEFKNNEMEMYHIFRKENKDWKVWNSVILEITYIE